MKITISAAAKLAVSAKYDGTNGLYMCAIPREDMLKSIHKICVDLGIENREDLKPEKFHVTVMYSKASPNVEWTHETFDILPSHLLMPVAVISGLDVFNGHDGKFYLVATLESHELNHLHNIFTNVGAVHSYPKYNPHITLVAFETREEYEQYKKTIDTVSDYLNANPVVIEFKLLPPTNIVGD